MSAVRINQQFVVIGGCRHRNGATGKIGRRFDRFGDAAALYQPQHPK
jgi:hypothetical protein